MASQPALPESPLPVQNSGFANPGALLKHLAETPRLARVTPATHLEVRPAPEMVSFGVDALDQLTGGLPRGCLTEISGPDSSGRTSVLLATLAAATRRGEICALIDASDAFHPRFGAAAGIDLARLLWVRCTPTPPAKVRGNSRSTNSGADFGNGSFPNDQRPSLACPELSEGTNERSNDRFLEKPVEQALRAADLLLQSGGFGLIAIDLAGVPVKIARRIPLTTWFRFRRAIEPTPTILLAIGEQPCAQTCATLSLRMAGQERSWIEKQSQAPSLSSGQAKDSRLSLGKKPSAFSTKHSAVNSPLLAISSQLSAVRSHISTRSSQLEAHSYPAHVHLLDTLPIRIELLRSRLERKPAQSATTFFTRSTDHPGRDGACPVSACPVSACPIPVRPISARPIPAHSAPTPAAAANNINAFTLRAHHLRAHG